MNKLIRYFDLLSEVRARGAEGKNEVKSLHWLPQYLVLTLGIVVQPFFSAYQQTGHWVFGGLLGRILFACIVGLIVFPAVYKKAFDPAKPLFVQLCAIFAVGMGWESVLKTAAKAIGG
jgi:hypothetical protein